MERGSERRSERSDARDNRRRLLDAARAALAEHGPSVSVNEIARAAGVGVGTLYRRYPTKADLIVALLGELEEELRAAIAERRTQAADPVDEFRAVVEAHLVVLGRVGPLDALLRAEAAGAAAQFPVADVLERFLAPLRECVARGVSGGVFLPTVDVELLARALYGLLDYQALAPRIEREGLAAVARSCADLLLFGLVRR
jgi:AcrR family transcriptional regulator